MRIVSWSKLDIKWKRASILVAIAGSCLVALGWIANVNAKFSVLEAKSLMQDSKITDQEGAAKTFESKIDAQYKDMSNKLDKTNDRMEKSTNKINELAEGQKRLEGNVDTMLRIMTKPYHAEGTQYGPFIETRTAGQVGSGIPVKLFDPARNSSN